MNHRLLPATLLLAAAVPALFGQGPLTPPGAPAPAMKALNQIASTGIEINVTNTPPPGNGSALYNITTSGAYFLASNLTRVSGKHGILVSADNVTIEYSTRRAPRDRKDRKDFRNRKAHKEHKG